MGDKKESPTLAGNGAVVYLKNLGTNHTTTPTPRKSCICCGYKFEPRQTFHRLCGQCYAYTQAGCHLQMAARLLRGVRS